MKEPYIIAEMELVKFDTEDVITTSFYLSDCAYYNGVCSHEIPF